jgi:hypothetical protein
MCGRSCRLSPPWANARQEQLETEVPDLDVGLLRLCACDSLTSTMTIVTTSPRRLLNRLGHDNSERGTFGVSGR